MAVGFSCDEELQELRSGGEQAVAVLFARYREQLLRMIALRLDARLLSKVDAEDVLQETFVIASRRIGDYLERPDVPLVVWFRRIAAQVLIDTHRRYLGTRMRDVRQEVASLRVDAAGTSSACLVNQLADSLTSPSQSVARQEILDRMRLALARLGQVDREVLLLRHLEGLTNNEVAQILQIDRFAASKRYLRALERLRTSMSAYA